jgi:protein-tyrosine phosphatase
LEPFSSQLNKLLEQLGGGKRIIVHCRQGIGRSALVAICLLILSGFDPANATQLVASARGCPVPETPEQHRWIADFAAGLVTGLHK